MFDIRHLYNHSIRKYLETETLSILSNLRVEIKTLFGSIVEHAENLAVERACLFFVYRDEYPRSEIAFYRVSSVALCSFKG